MQAVTAVKDRFVLESVGSAAHVHIMYVKSIVESGTCTFRNAVIDPPARSTRNVNSIVMDKSTATAPTSTALYRRAGRRLDGTSHCIPP